MSADDVKYSLPHDTANTLILPGKKRKIVKSSTTVESGPRKKKQKRASQRKEESLSKKKLKLLQKRTDNKRKRELRRDVIEKLSQYRISDAERQQILSFARINQPEKKRTVDNDDSTTDTTGPRKRNSIAGSRRGNKGGLEAPIRSSSGVYFETDSSSSSSAEEDEVEEEEREKGSQNEEIHEILKAEAGKEKEADTTASMAPSIVPKFTPLPSSAAAAATPRSPVAPVVHVPVFRTPEVQEARLKLPILGEEQPIVEAIKENPCVIICGETGSGKTTQVPQFLYEAGFCCTGRRIGITEPRRVAAISMSKRVGEEMNLAAAAEDSALVAYQIRYEGTATEDGTKIKFMTDGVLLKEIQRDFLLTAYSAIIVDEAHERSVYSDILIGLLSRIVPMRQKRGDPLKLVIMSATLRVEDFTQKHLFPRQTPLVLRVETRQYPVTVYFNKVTRDNYLAAAYRKVSQIHRLAPPPPSSADSSGTGAGGILVFVSGQKEVNTLIRWLKRRFPIPKHANRKNNESRSEAEEQEAEKTLKKKLKQLRKKNKKEKSRRRLTVKDLPSLDLDTYGSRVSENPKDANAANEDDRNDDEDHQGLDLLESDVLDLALFEDGDAEADLEAELDDLDVFGSGSSGETTAPLYCLPLYSLLPSHKQRLVFDTPPRGCRLCVVATNVAETSLTIPGIKYVVDTGKEKARVYDGVVGASKFIVRWISKASADQRAGRAGRTCTGHCYRLYSSAVFNNDFAEHTAPEILNKPVDELVLQMKSMNIVKTVNFPFPTRPDRETLAAAEARLLRLGALAAEDNAGAGVAVGNRNLKITQLGRTIALFPVKPEFGKMLSLGNQYGLLPYVVCLVAVLSVREPMKLISDQHEEEYQEMDNNNVRGDPETGGGGGCSNFLKMRREWACGNGSRSSQVTLLGDVSVLLRAMIEFEKTSRDWNQFCRCYGFRLDAMLEAKKMRRQLTEIIHKVCPDLQVQRENTELKFPDERQALLLRQLLLAGLGEHLAVKVDTSASSSSSDPAERKKLKRAYRTSKIKDLVYIHPNSILAKLQPKYVVYQEMVETSRKYLHTVTAVDYSWFDTLAQNYAANF